MANEVAMPGRGVDYSDLPPEQKARVDQIIDLMVQDINRREGSERVITRDDFFLEADKGIPKLEPILYVDIPNLIQDRRAMVVWLDPYWDEGGGFELLVFFNNVAGFDLVDGKVVNNPTEWEISEVLFGFDTSLEQFWGKAYTSNAPAGFCMVAYENDGQEVARRRVRGG